MAYLTSLDAKQFVGGNESAREVCDWAAELGGNVRTVEAKGEYVDQVPTHGFAGLVQSLIIQTTAGELSLAPGDHLVHGQSGQFFTVPPADFAEQFTSEA